MWDASSSHWTSQAEPELLSLTESPVTAAARTSEGLWVVLEDSLFLFDVSLVPVSWSTELDGSVIDLVAVGERLWLFTESSLYARADGRLSQVLVGGETPQAPLAVGPQYLWLARGQAIFALDPASGEVVDGHDLGDPVVAVGVDARGWVYAVTGTGVQVWQEQDVWTELEAPGAVSLRTVHTAEGAWIETLEGWMHHGREGLHVVLGADLAETASALDGLGRLLYTDETGLMRAAASRPVEITGLADGDRVEEPIVVSLVPTAPALLVELSASLVRGGDEVPVLVEADDTLTVDPFGLLFGSWTLRVEARTVLGGQEADVKSEKVRRRQRQVRSRGGGLLRSPIREYVRVCVERSGRRMVLPLVHRDRSVSAGEGGGGADWEIYLVNSQ